MKGLNKKSFVIGVCLGGILLLMIMLYVFQSLPFALLIHGYHSLKYKVYKQVNDDGDSIIRIPYLEGDFNYAMARKRLVGWDVVYDGIKSSLEYSAEHVLYLMKYNPFIWSNHILVTSHEQDSRIEVKHHRIIEGSNKIEKI